MKNGLPVGVLWHDTGAGNPNLKRYVQPHESDANYKEMIALIGKNEYSNDWNHTTQEAGVNAWIGKLANGSIGTIQASPFDFHPWGCGSGVKGSCNGYVKKDGKSEYVKPFWIQFEICDDGYKDKAYFQSAYKEAVEFTAHICKLYGIDPHGSHNFNGVTVPTILCHKDSHDLQLGSNHADIYTWFSKFGYSMENVRNDVSALLKESAGQQNKADNSKEFIDAFYNFAKDYFNK